MVENNHYYGSIWLMTSCSLLGTWLPHLVPTASFTVDAFRRVEYPQSSSHHWYLLYSSGKLRNSRVGAFIISRKFPKLSSFNWTLRSVVNIPVMVKWWWKEVVRGILWRGYEERYHRSYLLCLLGGITSPGPWMEHIKLHIEVEAYSSSQVMAYGPS